MRPAAPTRAAVGLFSLASAADLAQQAAATAAGAHGLYPALARLHQHPALAGERHLHRLAGAAADEVLELDVGLDARLDAGGPRDGRLRIRERGRLAGVQQHGRAIRDDRHPARPLKRGVEEPAAHHAGHALHALDVPVDPGVEREEVRPIHRDGVVLEVDQVDVLGGVRQEDLAGAVHLHQGRALTRYGLLDHAAEAARACVLERHVALVRHHRPGLRLDRDLVEAHLQQLGVLKCERLVGLRFLKLAKGALHLASFNLDRVGTPTLSGRATRASRPICRVLAGRAARAVRYTPGAPLTLGCAPFTPESSESSGSSGVKTDSTEVLRRPSDDTSSLKSCGWVAALRASSIATRPCWTW